MLKISQLVEEIIKNKPFLHEALNQGIINNAALAEQILPEIEQKTSTKIKFQTINMAIRRFAEKQQTIKTNKPPKFTNNTDIILRSNLIETTIFKNENSQEIIKKLYDEINIKQGDFLTITQGINEIMFLTNKKNLNLMKTNINQNLIKDITKNLSSLTINLPLEFKNSIGFFLLISKTLSWENINIIDIVSTLTEITVIVDENNASKTFDTLNKMIKKNSTKQSNI